MIQKSFAATGLTAEIADAIYRLTSLVKYDERFVIPPAHREEAIEMIESTDDRKGNAGFGEKMGTRRVF
jgi:nitrate reductase beta subunit